MRTSHAVWPERLLKLTGMAAVGALSIGALTGCAGTLAASAPAAPSIEVVENGGARAVIATKEDLGAADALFEGTAVLDNDDCWSLQDGEGHHFPVRWPFGTTLGEEVLLLPDDTQLAVGSPVSLGGGVVRGGGPGREESVCWTDADEVIIAATASVP